MAGEREFWLKRQAEFYQNKLQRGKEAFDSGPYAQAKKQKWLSFVRQFVFDGATALDVGSGDGWQSRWLAENGAAQVMAVDLTPGFVEKARFLTPPNLLERISYVCCAIEDFHTDLKFDIVVMTDVFEHLFEPACVLELLANCMTKSSTLLIRTLNRVGMRNAIRNLQGRSKISTAHFKEYTQGEVVGIVRGSGLTVDKIVGLGFLPGIRRLKKQHKNLIALDLWLGEKMPGLAGGMMLACRKGKTS